MVSKYYCNTIHITCSRVLNLAPGRLDLGGPGFKSPGNTHFILSCCPTLFSRVTHHPVPDVASLTSHPGLTKGSFLTTHLCNNVGRIR